MDKVNLFLICSITVFILFSFVLINYTHIINKKKEVMRSKKVDEIINDEPIVYQIVFDGYDTDDSSIWLLYDAERFIDDVHKGKIRLLLVNGTYYNVEYRSSNSVIMKTIYKEIPEKINNNSVLHIIGWA
jgi:hypothetical protein